VLTAKRRPVPIPAHQTGRARFEHPSFRWTSPQSSSNPRQRANPKYLELAKDPLIAIVFGASRLHFMAAFQEMPYAIRDVIVDFSYAVAREP